MTSPSDSPTLTVPVEAAAVIFDELIEAVTTQGARVTLTRDGARVAVIVPWAWYRRRMEALARHEVAYWRAWSDGGTFDGAAYAHMAADLNEPLEPTPLDESQADRVPDPPSSGGGGA